MFTKRHIKTLVIASIFGLLVGIVFIFVQPLFGMSPLTTRHAEGYVNLSSMNFSTAIIIAWSVHLFISAVYGLSTGIAFLIGRNNTIFIIAVMLLAWITTVIAPPANAWLVKSIGTQSLASLNQLPALNFLFDSKLILHILFFAAIAIPQWLLEKRHHLIRDNEDSHTDAASPTI